MCVEVLETIVSEVKEVRSVALTSSEKPVILYGDAEKKAGFVHEVLEPRVGLQGLSPHGRCVPIAVPIRKGAHVRSYRYKLRRGEQPHSNSLFSSRRLLDPHMVDIDRNVT